MKLVLTDDYVPGVLAEQGVVDLVDVLDAKIMALPGKLRMAAIIEQWDTLEAAIDAARTSGKPRKEFTLRAPLPRPGKMLFASSNYKEYLEDYIRVPIDMFMKSPSTIIDPHAEIKLPTDDVQLFFHEAELGVVIGKGGRDIAAATALDHVFGYICVNDVSSFGLPGAMGGMRNKNFDCFGPIGPCIVTKDEIPDPHALDVKLWVDDALRQDYNTSDMEHRIPALIEWASHIATLEPGDLLACGTNHGGLGPIQHGEIMRMQIEGVGEIANRVFDPLARRWPVGPDRHFEEWVLRFKTTGVAEGPLFSTQRLDGDAPTGS